ncbi:MAG: hypothetical protein R3362_03665, partial [Rhodothermales bacterium]|nr:hypothetical protein [Rhodothermales bacterium]
MPHSDSPRGPRVVHPLGLPGPADAGGDPLLRNFYGTRMEAAAEKFLLAAFDVESQNPFGE